MIVIFGFVLFTKINVKEKIVRSKIKQGLVLINYNQTHRLIGGGVATSPGSSRKTGSLPRRDCSPDTPFVGGKAFFTDFAASSTFSLAFVKVCFNFSESGSLSRTVFTASFT
jgi:hypothetical protein